MSEPLELPLGESRLMYVDGEPATELPNDGQWHHVYIPNHTPQNVASFAKAKADGLTADDVKRLDYHGEENSMNDQPPRDAGQFYWGRVDSFLNLAPLIDKFTIMIPVKTVDINTEADWKRAEKLYEEAHETV